MVALQQSLNTQREETETIRRERDAMHEDVIKLEAELNEHKQLILELEDREREKEESIRTTTTTNNIEIENLKRENDLLTVRL